MRQTPEEKAAAAAAELRAVIREAHETAQALAEVMRAARAQVDGYLHDQVQAATDNYTSQMQAAIHGWANDAHAEALRVMKLLNAAMGAVCTIVVDGLKDPYGPSDLRADIVIDLRGAVPVMADPDSEQGRAILADAQYKVVMGPGAGPLWRGAGHGSTPS